MINQHQTNRDNIEKFNKAGPLVDYLIPLVGDRIDVQLLDIGSGPYSIIGSYLEGKHIDLRLADNQDFTDFWEKYNATPYFPVEYQDMEKLTYPDSFFDIVHSANALDHTINAWEAVKEMIRVCKPGGWIYIQCYLDQLSTGHKHYWNAREDGVFQNNGGLFDLKDLGFKIEFIDKGGESRYNSIIATLRRKKGWING